MEDRRTRITAMVAAAVAVVAVVALVVTTYLNVGAHEDTAGANATPGPVDGRPAPGNALDGTPDPSPSPTDPTGDGHDIERYTPDPKAANAIRSVAVRFVNAWKTPGTEKERTAALRPLATDHLTSLLARVDPRELPSRATVTGTPKLVAATPYSAGAEMKLSNGMTVRVNLLMDTGGWRVTEILPPEQEN